MEELRPVAVTRAFSTFDEVIEQANRQRGHNRGLEPEQEHALVERLVLDQPLLAGLAEVRLQRDRVERHERVHDPLDLAELVHQPGLVLQPPGRVHDDDVDTALDAGLHRLEGDARRVTALGAGDDVDPDALAPRAQLLGRGGAEGVGGGQQHVFAELALEAMRQLGDQGGLAGAVHADDEDDAGVPVPTGDLQAATPALTLQRGTYYVQVDGPGEGVYTTVYATNDQAAAIIAAVPPLIFEVDRHQLLKCAMALVGLRAEIGIDIRDQFVDQHRLKRLDIEGREAAGAARFDIVGHAIGHDDDERTRAPRRERLAASLRPARISVTPTEIFQHAG